MEDSTVQDFLVEDKWIDKKTGEARVKLRKVGVTFKLPGGGSRHKFYTSVSISEGGLSLPQRKKASREMADEPESGETGDGWRE